MTENKKNNCINKQKKTEGRLTNIARWLEQNWSYYTEQSTPYIFGVLCIWLSYDLSALAPELSATNETKEKIKMIFFNYSTWITIIFIPIAVFSARSTKNKISNLESALSESKEKCGKAELKDIEARSAIDEAQQHAEFLRQKFDELLVRGAASFLKRHVRDVSDFGDHARISLYAHVDSKFILAGRFTEHPDNIKPNRQVFPDDQGCIGEAWRNGGECFVELPDPVSQPEVYAQTLRDDWGIRKNTSKNLRMRSAFYYAKAINSDTMRAGVVVYESTRSDILIEEQLKRLAEQDEEHLARIIEQAKFVNPFMTIQRGRYE